MSSSPAVEPSSPSTTTPSSPALRAGDCTHFHTSTPNYTNKKQNNTQWNVVLPAISTNPPAVGELTFILKSTETTLTPPPRSPGAAPAHTPASGDGRGHPPDGTSSDKSSETAAGVSRAPSTALSRKESYKAQRQHYRREKKRAASALLHSIEDPTVVVLADWLKVRGSLKSWTKLWCVLKPGILLLYKSPKAKSSHWVGTVLLTSCRVIERPSKKDGFCFKLYHPLEQNIWAPRGPHNETIGAVVQPLPTAHLIFRAPSQAAGHCWLDGLELALQCSNAMLRCSRSRPEATLEPETPAAQTNISHEELERHFNEHVKQIDSSTRSSPIPIVIHDNSPHRCNSADPKPKKIKSKSSKLSQFIEYIEMLAKEHDSCDSTPESDKKDLGFLDLLKKKDAERNLSEFKQKRLSKSLASSPLKIDIPKKTPILKYFDLPKSAMSLGDKNKIISKTPIPKRRSSTPSTSKCKRSQRISDLRESGAKTDSENDDVKTIRKFRGSSEILCDASNACNNILITKTAPSIERFRETSTSSTDDDKSKRRHNPSNGKFSLINYSHLPSTSFEALKSERRDERFTTQNVYVTGKVLTDGEMFYPCLQLYKNMFLYNFWYCKLQDNMIHDLH
ncbi:Oxysterol-binding protein-related protein 8 [Papilio xuthus]|uniref:Oxysterol-binding protein-related protein 8 n=1 Tax=Papilio xuthus TaxID=66420 RepID=A0A194Q4M8_PAPXU|nr:Oxysterol-binding protein-related protein 8 [Papilio xuthus]